MNHYIKKQNTVNSYARRLLLAAAVLALTALCFLPAYAGNDGLSGANIKDGQLVGYYGDGGDIVIPNTVTMIGNNAFSGNDNVTSVTIPGSVSEISYSAFENCSALEKVIFADPESSAKLVFRLNAFAGCKKLSDITIPARTCYITGNIFKECTSLKEIKVEANDYEYCTDDEGVLYGPPVDYGEPVLGTGETKVQSYPAGRENTHYDMPSVVNGLPVKSIFAGAFERAVNLKTISISDSVTAIGSASFSGSGLTEIVIPDTVNQINASVFRDCKSLTDVTLPSSFTGPPTETGYLPPGQLGMYIFYGCENLARIDFGDNLKSIEMHAFDGCTSLTSVILPHGVTSLSYSVFDNCSNLQKVLLPDSLLAIGGEDGYSIFDGCHSNLTLYGSNWTDSTETKHSLAYRYATLNKLKFQVVSNPADLTTVPASDVSLTQMGAKTKVEGAFPIQASLKTDIVTSGPAYKAAYEQADGKAVAVYSIKVLPEDITLPSSMTVKIGLPSTMTKKAKMYKISDDNTLTELSADLIGSTFSVATDSLGYFALIDPTTSGGNTPDPDAGATSVTINKSETSIEEGKTQQLRATVLPSDLSDKSVIWTSSDENIATVSSTGVVTGKKEGFTIITATATNGVYGICKVTVTASGDTPEPGATSVTIDKEKISIQEEISHQLNATVLPSDLSDKSVTWTSSDANIATVSSTGLVTGVKAGTVTITATAKNGVYGTCTVTVIAKSEEPSGEIVANLALKSAVVTETGKLPFSISLKKAENIANVTVDFETAAVSSADQVEIEGINGFTAIGDVTGKVENGVFKGQAVFAYLTNDQTTFSCTKETAIALISLKTTEKNAMMKISSAAVAGWKSDKVPAFGTVESIDPSEATSTLEKTYDLNGDGKVDLLDLTEAQLHYQATSTDSNWAEAYGCDFNGDNKVDIEDYIDLRLHFTENK